jgi:ring-1,2-phenylacetyl-CoA epoxidase subunit PaaA
MGFGLWAVKRCIQFGGNTARARLQARVPKFIAMGLGHCGRPSLAADNASRNFDRYYEMGIKIMRPEETQERYLELTRKRLNEAGLEWVDDVEADYDMRTGYAMDDAELDARMASAV